MEFELIDTIQSCYQCNASCKMRPLAHYECIRVYFRKYQMDYPNS